MYYINYYLLNTTQQTLKCPLKWRPIDYFDRLHTAQKKRLPLFKSRGKPCYILAYILLKVYMLI